MDVRTLSMVELPPKATSPARARRYVERALVGCQDSVVEIAALLVTELVANAVRHARTAVRVGIEVDDERVRIEVTDSSPDLPVARRPKWKGATTGRGLVIIDRLTDAWGVDELPGGKTIWVEVGRAGRYLDRSSERRKNSPRPATPRTRAV